MKKVFKTLKDMDRVILVISIGLFIFGLFNILTASSQASVIRYNESLFNYFIKQLIFLSVGFFISCLVVNFPTKGYRLFGLPLFIFIVFLCVLVIFYGKEYSGNKNWIPIGGFSLQPSEFAKPVLIVYLAILYEKYFKIFRSKVRDENYINKLGIIIFVSALIPLFVLFTQHDLGTFLLLTFLVVILFYASPIVRREKFLLSVVLIPIALICGIFYFNGHSSDSQNSRLKFWDPCSRYEDGGYQVCNGYIAVNSGGLLGVGIGQSRQKSYIPEPHTDFVFTIIAEEYGLVVTTIIFFLYTVILYRVLHLASVVGTVRGRYICYGVAVYMFLHILINMGGLFGIMPLTGVPLPFLSYGGSFTIAFMIALALVQRVHIEYKNEKIKI